ncbi:large ribosomal subunit protein mL64 [Hyperolius riggenbachi]|uniref:large ribosomal subunit protein mL64 n=1 Tax=Hyperolius riggenbachi TaxID=752182 RepID=UPI0035A2B38B
MALPMQRCWGRLRAVTLQCAAGYHAKPRTTGFGGMYKPDPADPDIKEWHKGPKYEAKLYGRYGSASGVNPESLWPSPEQLLLLQEEEKEWYPSLQEMLNNVKQREKEALQKKLERERMIAANMAKMPKMVADWRKAKREARLKEREEKAKKQRLLLLAQEKFGTSVDLRSPKFLEMVKEMEKEEKKKLKAVKRQQREEERAAMTAAIKAATQPKPETDGAV